MHRGQGQREKVGWDKLVESCTRVYCAKELHTISSEQPQRIVYVLEMGMRFLFVK